MIYVLYKEGLPEFKTDLWRAMDIKIAQGWKLLNSYTEETIAKTEEPIKKETIEIELKSFKKTKKAFE